MKLVYLWDYLDNLEIGGKRIKIIFVLEMRKLRRIKENEEKYKLVELALEIEVLVIFGDFWDVL